MMAVAVSMGVADELQVVAEDRNLAARMVVAGNGGKAEVVGVGPVEVVVRAVASKMVAAAVPSLAVEVVDERSLAALVAASESVLVAAEAPLKLVPSWSEGRPRIIDADGRRVIVGFEQRVIFQLQIHAFRP